MTFMERVSNVMKKILPKPELKPDLSDDETRDKVLRSLRRQQRLHDEEQEKIMLRERIAAYQTERNKRLTFGVGEDKVLHGDNAFKHNNVNVLSSGGVSMVDGRSLLGKGKLL